MTTEDTPGDAASALLEILDDFENEEPPFDESTDDPLTKVVREMTSEGAVSGDEELARFITFNIATNTRRDAETLSNRVRGFWETERWIFEPEILVGEDRYDDLLALFKGHGEFEGHPVTEEHGQMELGKQDAKFWYVIAYTLYHEFDSDALALLNSQNNSACELKEYVSEARHPDSIHEKVSTTKKFPGIGGDKNSTLWPREIHDHVRSLEDIALLPMPVDVQIVKVTNYIFETDYTVDDKDDIRALYWDFCEEYDRTATVVDKPLWTIGTYWDDWGKEYLDEVLGRPQSSSSIHDLERAIEIALEVHEGDTDKAGEPYIRHPLRLMEAVDTPEERIAAVLHDVVEDSEHDLNKIENEFGSDIRDAVDALTKRNDEDYLEDYIPRVKRNEIARAVKKADLQDTLDVSRLSEVDEGTCERIQKYHRALQQLENPSTE